MRKLPKSRASKINFLRKLQKGEASIKDIMGEEVEVWFFEDGKYINSGTGEVLTDEEWSARCPNDENVSIVDFSIC